MNIPQQIDAIIASRRARRDTVRTKIDRIGKLKSVVDTFETFRASAAGDPEQMNSLNSIDVTEFRKCCSKALGELDRIDRRFARDHIHISFVGRAGQGKSCVMQQISGLDSRIIPSSDGSDCTGAKSVITNCDRPDVSAEITFFTASEIVSIVNEYLKNIFGGRESGINDVREIPLLKARNLEKNISFAEVEAGARLKHLNAYIDHIGEFAGMLGKTFTVPAEQIEEYIAQYNHDNADIKYWKYLGVKEANISCNFPFGQCGKIVLVDTIGLGATSIGVEDKMLEAIRNDSDAIIYMLRPDTMRPKDSDDDYRIIEKIKNEVSAEYAREMLFWLFNRVETANGNNTKHIGGLVAEIEGRIAGGKLPMAKALNVNCSDRADVENGLLVPVLEQMASRLGEIDELLLRRADDALNRLTDIFGSLARHMLNSFKVTVSSDVKRRFEDEAASLYRSWVGKVRGIYERIETQQDTHKIYQECFNKVLKEVLRLPKEEAVLEMLDARGDLGAAEVMSRIINRVRINIIDNFLELDIPLGSMLKELKTEVTRAMAETGRLGALVQASVEDPEEWLTQLTDVISSDENIDSEDCEAVCRAIRELRDFTVSVKGCIIFGVVRGVASIDPQMSSETFEIAGVQDHNRARQARSIHQHLERQVNRAFGEIQKHSKEGRYLQYPNDAFFAAVKTFHDRVSKSGIAMVGEKARDVSRIWEYLYVDHIHEIWKDETAEMFSRQELVVQWRTVRDAIKDALASLSRH